MDLLTLQQAIQKLGISDSTMRRYMRKKKLPYQKIEGRYYFHESDINKLLPKQSDTQEAIHEIFMKISNIEQEIETLKQQVSQMPSHLEQRLAKLEAQAQSSSTPQTAQPPPTPHSEPAKPSVPHSSAIAGLPAESIHIQDFLSLHHLKSHRRKIIGYMDAPRNGLKFHAVPKLNREGEADRYLDPLQQDTLLAWLHVHHPEVFIAAGPGED